MAQQQKDDRAEQRVERRKTVSHYAMKEGAPPLSINFDAAKNRRVKIAKR